MSDYTILALGAGVVFSQSEGRCRYGSMIYVHECPEHGRFEAARPIETETRGITAPCPVCAAPVRKVMVCDPRTQILVSKRFMETIPLTGFKSKYGNGPYQDAVRDYNRWDSPNAGPLPGNDLPAHMR